MRGTQNYGFPVLFCSLGESCASRGERCRVASI